MKWKVKRVPSEGADRGGMWAEGKRKKLRPPTVDKNCLTLKRTKCFVKGPSKKTASKGKVKNPREPSKGCSNLESLVERANKLNQGGHWYSVLKSNRKRNKLLGNVETGSRFWTK